VHEYHFLVALLLKGPREMQEQSRPANWKESQELLGALQRGNSRQGTISLMKLHQARVTGPSAPAHASAPPMRLAPGGYASAIERDLQTLYLDGNIQKKPGTGHANGTMALEHSSSNDNIDAGVWSPLPTLQNIKRWNSFSFDRGAVMESLCEKLNANGGLEQRQSR
jgi:hypothetical protein